MSLPEELDQEVWQSLQQLEEEKHMPYITSVERIGIQKGIQQGRFEGIREGLLEAIELGLDLKFGSEGLNLLPEISRTEDVEELRAIKAGLKTVNTLDDLRLLIQQSAH